MFFSISTETRPDNREITIKFQGGTDTTFSTMFRAALGTIQYLPESLSLMLEQSSHSTDHSPPASDKVKNMGNCTSTSAYIIFSEVIRVLYVRNVKCTRWTESWYTVYSININNYCIPTFGPLCISTTMCSCNNVIGMFVGDNFLGHLSVSLTITMH